MKKKRHIGFSADRLKPNQDNPREVVFAERWREENDRFNILAKLIPDYTERDEQVAATIIQWLGSNVGIGFLSEVAEANPKIAEWFRRAVVNAAKNG